MLENLKNPLKECFSFDSFDKFENKDSNFNND